MPPAADVAKIAQQSAAALQSLLGNSVPRVLKEGKLSLLETLSRLPRAGEGARVHQARWTKKGIDNCYWQVTRCTTKNEGKSGKVWGLLVWRGECTRVFNHTHNSLEHHFCPLGKPISTRPERIRGALKYHWKEGVSSAPAQSASTPSTPAARPRSAA
jgi:small subunit ribosomal protein S34